MPSNQARRPAAHLRTSQPSKLLFGVMQIERISAVCPDWILEIRVAIRPVDPLRFVLAFGFLIPGKIVCLLTGCFGRPEGGVFDQRLCRQSRHRLMRLEPITRMIPMASTSRWSRRVQLTPDEVLIRLPIPLEMGQQSTALNAEESQGGITVLFPADKRRNLHAIWPGVRRLSCA